MNKLMIRGAYSTLINFERRLLTVRIK